ncbi:hypothetical protein TSUD_182990 [Trifolium subterraneum]|uniref:Uncharacterized protein n=1 Tax=Trifolium subterraneum TaxID=3900 RepID=A0A2Z6P7X5_TRISU|nr:hypothetical protein TSUD_182990 [Trifolium subterraneum]
MLTNFHRGDDIALWWHDGFCARQAPQGTNPIISTITLAIYIYHFVCMYNTGVDTFCPRTRAGWGLSSQSDYHSTLYLSQSITTKFPRYPFIPRYPSIMPLGPA